MSPESLSHELKDDVASGAALQGREFSTPARRTLAGRLWYFWSLFVAAMLLLVIGPPAIAVSYLAGRREWLYPWALFGARQWLRLSGARVRVHGLEQLDPRRSYVFVANHRSFLDTAALFAYTGRRIGIIAKKELLKVPIMGYGMGYVNILAIDRTNRESAVRTMKAATDCLRRGVSFGVFAEGTRALPHQLLPFKKGAFYMAAEAGVPVVPVAIKNTDEMMGKGTGVARPGLIEMVFLPPVETAGLSTDEEIRNLSERVNAIVGAELGVSSSKPRRPRGES
jgi:1-acyl-sn-glycerol-3-phosphate acyltransferase